MHPRERSIWRMPRDRRSFLRLTAGTAAGAVLLNACGRSGADGSDTELAVGTPGSPAQQPLFDDLPAVESGLEPEAGPLQVFNWSDYINTETLDAFAEEYGVEYEVTTFYNIDEATRKLASGELVADVFVPTSDTLPKFVAGKLLQPLNLEYVPNLAANVWPRLADPYYDQGSRYSVPYTVYTTGMAWRTDQVDIDPEALDNAWSVFWDPEFAGITGLYDDFRESISAALFYNGASNVNTAARDELEAAQASLVELVDLMNIRYTIDGAYAKLPEGEFGLHHAWSGDLVNAPYYMPEGGDPSVLRFYWPARGGNGAGNITSDTLTIPTNAEHPVLAHHFLDYMLRPEAALQNFEFNGYQPPQITVDADALIADEYVPEYLESAVVRESDFELEAAQVPVQLSVEAEASWREVWSAAQAGG